MSQSYYNIKGSLFDTAQKSANNFGHNLFMTNAIQQCIAQLEKAQQEYESAISLENKNLAVQKEIEIQTYQSSLVLTAHVLYETEDIET
mgnify:CR=1 FL=1